MTPTRKGLYLQCEHCIFKEVGTGKRYPCEYSHSQVRIASGRKLERDFENCGLRIEVPVKEAFCISNLILTKEEWLDTVNDSGMTNRDQLHSLLNDKPNNYEYLQEQYTLYYGKYLDDIESILG